MKELCQRILDDKGMPNDWKTSLLIAVFKEERGMMNCSHTQE